MCLFEEPLIYWNNFDSYVSAYACDFKTSNIAGDPYTSISECSELCLSFDSCTHFSYNNATCWIKGGNITPNDAVFNNDYKTLCGYIKIQQVKT